MRFLPRARLFTALAVVCGASIGLAQDAKDVGAASADSGTVSAPALAPISINELEAFVDGFMMAYLEAEGAAGGVVAVVQRGQTILAKGYGQADVSSDREVDPERTLFRIGSVSKLFVWTAVMQLVESGDLDLAADVNGYLEEVTVPDTFDQPITLGHLMTHSAGFEDRALGLFSRRADDLAPLADILASELPGRVRPPGQVSSYSNHGTALAMLVVESVSGLPWETYLARNILGPLGMTRTTFAQPPPSPLDDDLSRGYRLEGDELREETFEFVPLAPVGAASSTATDMARFMIAHLQLGRLGEARILEEETAAVMQGALFRHSEAVNPMAHGFIDSSRNGQRIVGHGGDTPWFHTQMEILPQHDLGIFVSMNTAGANPSQLTAAFVDRYFPTEDPPPVATPVDWSGRVARYVGSFRSNRFSHSDLTKLVALRGRIEVADSGDGALLFSVFGETRWVEESPLLFREEGSHRRAAFRQEEDGRITHLFLGDTPHVAFERVPPRESHRLHALLLVSSSALLVATLVLQPLGAYLRWRYHAPLEREYRVPTSARVVLWVGSLMFVVFGVSLAVEMSDPLEIIFGVTPGLRTVLALPLVAAVLALIALTFAVWLWREQQGRFLARLSYTAVVIAFFVLLWQLAIWRLLGGA
ncbi:MAG: serine hydrolase domain-containing protein [Acidobacteriota bacterium]|nr:serine hydrolase domain-containing protein [Acidobacteriota bacterium]